MVILRCGVVPLPHLPGATSTIFGPRGVDRVVVTYPIDPTTRIDPTLWNTTKRGLNAEFRTTDLGLRNTHVTVTDHPEGRSSRIDVTPAYALGEPTNVLLTADDAVRTLLRDLMALASSLLVIQPIGAADDATVTRLDVAQNLSTSSPAVVQALLHAFATHRPAYAGKTTIVKGAGAVQSVKKGSKARAALLYDKGIESRACPPGTLRWECRLGRDQLRRRSLSTLADLHGSRIEAARSDLWRWSGMDLSAVPRRSVLSELTELLSNGHISRQTADAITGYVMLGAEDLSRSSVRRRQKTLEELGMSHFDEARLALPGVQRIDVDPVTGIVTVG